MDVDGERPVHLVLDCTSGQGHEKPLTDEQWAAHRQAEAEGEARAQAEAERLRAEGEAIRGLVDAHPDPLVKLLAQRVGLAITVYDF